MNKEKNLLNFSILNIDKPCGPTSFQVSQYIKRSLNLKKTANMGTLDPQVSGVLPITLGRACRLAEFLMHKDKTYIGIMRLHSPIQLKKLKEEMEQFLGEITQLPPVRSRVKLAERQRTIKTFKILEAQDKKVLFETQVQAGTYIRKLIHDLGEKIQGAHMLELRRTQAGIFKEDTLVNLYDFEKAVNEYNQGNSKQLEKMLIPAETALKQIMPSIQVPESLVKQLLLGKPLFKEDISKLPKEDIFSVFCKERFIGVYHEVEDKNIIAKPSFVYN